MPRPTDKAELTTAAAHEFARLWAAVDAVPDASREKPGACASWSVKDLLAHLHAWHEMALTWEREGRAGGTPEIPAPGYRFSETPALNEAIYERTKDDSWNDVVGRLRTSHEAVLAVIDRYGEEDLFTKQRYPWTKSTSVGAYFVSATSSHYAWASKLIRAWTKRTNAS